MTGTWVSTGLGGLIIMTTIINLQLTVPGVSAVAWKISPQLKDILEQEEAATIIISMREDNGDIISELQSKTFSSRSAKIESLALSLNAFAIRSQRTVLDFLKQKGLQDVVTLWTTNQIIVRGVNAVTVEELTMFEQVTRISEDSILPLVEPMDVDPVIVNHNETPWGILAIKAPEVWRTGNRGSGVILANMDTGVSWEHEALVSNYLGDGGWLDPIENSNLPSDVHGHGTHTMGTLVGSTRNIGVAPDAKWMACKGCSNRGVCLLSYVLQCGQWLTCPSDSMEADNINCSKAANVINHSWAGPNNDYFDKTIACYHAAGIIPIFALGNSGPGCGTTEYPGNSPRVIGVGATSVDNSVAVFSSRGPASSNILKPDVSAPGAGVLSASHRSNSGYAINSGTSMATPHVAGLVALMLSKNLDLGFDQVKEALFAGCVHTVSKGQRCRNTPDGVFPNNSAGFGRIDANNTLAYVGKFKK